MRGIGQGNLLPFDVLHETRDELADKVDNIFHIDERHLDVELGEFRLAVGAKVFVAEAARHLNVTVVARDHEKLLIELRRLRQRVERALSNAARNEIVARAFGRALAKNRRFDFEEPVLVEIIAQRLRNAVAKRENALHLRTPKVDIAVFQAHLFGRNFRRRREERDRLGPVQNDELRRFDFNFARRHIAINESFGPREHFAFDLNDVFVMERLDELKELWIAVGDVKDRLRLAVTVANIDKENAAMIARGIDPSAQRNRFSDVRRAQFAACFSSKHRYFPSI